ncbi:Imm1 family immunity protein [Saccharothrix carnea]|uniref:Imm1 family immunity protein n=1 Tax=Saccharothrix TaxID=2071 RepID=UPI0009390EC1
MIVTAVLTTGVARVAEGIRDAMRLVDDVLRTDHAEWETLMYIGEREFRVTREGPHPNHQLRVSVRPVSGFAALNYTDQDDSDLVIANSYNPIRPLPDIDLVFSGSTGTVFPRSAAIPISDARSALSEWLTTRRRPTCIEWRPYDAF